MFVQQSIKRKAAMRKAARRVGVGAVMSMLAGLAGPAMAAPLDPSGLWWTKERESIIKIAPCGANYCGSVVWLKEPNDKDGAPKLDRQNSDATKRKRPMLGLEILLDMAAESDHWAGKAYNPDDGKTYDITFKVNPEKTVPVTATIRGCLLIFCQSDTFTHADAIPVAPAAPVSAAAPAARPPAKR